MGYFEGLTDINFKTDDEGKTLFFPWGVIGRGYVLPDESKKQQIRRFKRIYHVISIPCMGTIAIAILGGWFYCSVLILIFPLWYFLGTTLLLKGLPLAYDSKLSIKESYANSSKAHNIKTLWLMLFFSVLFVLAGVVIFLFDKSTWFLSLICILFFGTSGCGVGYMIKNHHKGQSG